MDEGAVNPTKHKLLKNMWNKHVEESWRFVLEQFKLILLHCMCPKMKYNYVTIMWGNTLWIEKSNFYYRA